VNPVRHTYADRMDRSGESDLLLSEQLCFALYSASRAVVGCYRPLLEEIGLTYSQYLVMLVLWEHDTVDFGRLCTDLHLDSGSLSPVVKRLEANGLLTRHRRAADERTVEVRCTRQGHALRDGAVDVQRRVERATGLSRDELVRMRDDLNALSARMRDDAAVTR
jgi:MarR family transcriptional regulator, organic hydroperoxide resistance regulator